MKHFATKPEDCRHSPADDVSCPIADERAARFVETYRQSRATREQAVEAMVGQNPRAMPYRALVDMLGRIRADIVLAVIAHPNTLNASDRRDWNAFLSGLHTWLEWAESVAVDAAGTVACRRQPANVSAETAVAQ